MNTYLNTYSRCLLYCLVALIASMVLLSQASAYECNADTMFWVTLNESTGNYSVMCATDTGVDTGSNHTAGFWNGSATFAQSWPGSLHWVQLGGVYNTPDNASITAWVYRTAGATAPNTYAVISGKANIGGAPEGLSFFYEQATGGLSATAGNYVPFTSSTLAIPLNQWVFVAAVKNSTHFKFYVNATTNIQPDNHTIATGVSPYSIARWGLYSFYWVGSIDEVTLWNTALTDAQISNLYLYNNVTGLGAPPSPNCTTGVCGVVSDCANQTGLGGVAVYVFQHNSTNDFSFNALTNASGYFNISAIEQNLTAQIVYTLDPYLSVENEFIITNSSPAWNGSTCLALAGTPYRIDTSWALMSNETSQLDVIQSHSDWKPNVTYKKDVLLDLVQFDVFSGGEPVTGLDLNGSVVTTTCSFAVTPSSYAVFSSPVTGTAGYSLYANISGVFVQNLYAYCQDGDFFDINFLGAGLNAKGRIDFQAYQMRASNVQLMVDNATLINATYANYTWAYALADFYQDTGDNRNIAMNNLTCSARLVYGTGGPPSTAWENAVILNNHAWVNFTTLTTTPVVMLIQWNCTSPGFDYFDQLFQVSIGEDAFTLAQCLVADPNGYPLDWNKVGQQINHWCAFRTYWNVSLLDMKVKSSNANTNAERVFKFSYDQNNQYYFSTGLFYDDAPKGLNQWDVILTGYPADIYPGVVKYYQFVKVYSTPPSKISPDYCDGENCPKSLYKGENYFCKVQTTFEAEYTNIVAGIKLNGTNVLYSIKPVDAIVDAVNHVHETSFSITALGEKDQYGISSDTTIQCYFELYIDADKLVYGETNTQMLTKYRASYPSDFLGFQKNWNEFANQKDKTNWLFNKIGNIPAWFMSSIHITDANGNVNPILLVIYLIAFALLAALAIMWTTRRK